MEGCDARPLTPTGNPRPPPARASFWWTIIATSPKGCRDCSPSSDTTFALSGIAFDAIALAEVFRPQIAILDIGLPTIDGYTLARELRTRLADSAPLLIALSGYGQPHDRQRSDASGFALHLVKPVDVDELIAALSSPLRCRFSLTLESRLRGV